MEKSSSIFNFKNLPYGLAGLVILFLIAETAARIFWDPAWIDASLYRKYEPNYRYGYSEQTPVFYPAEDGLICMTTQYTQFHTQVLPGQKQRNEIRIFTLGGSVSRGEPEASYSYYLEHQLNADFPEHTWRVINLSCGGYGSARMLVVLKKILHLEPDFLILHPHGSNEYEDERDFNYQQKINSGINRLVYSSHFLVLSKKNLAWLTSAPLPVSDGDTELKASAVPENVLRWNAAMDRNLQSMMEIAKERGIGVALVGRSERNDGGSGYADAKTEEINRIIRKQLAFPRSVYVDTPAIMYRSNPEPEGKGFLFSDTTHWQDIGHRIVADQLVKEIVSLVEDRTVSSRKRYD